MLFWIILFITYYCILLVKGGVCREHMVELAELEIKSKNTNSSYEKDAIMQKQIKLTYPAFIVFVMVIVETILLTRIIKLDPYLYPTLAMLIHTIVSAVISAIRNKKRDLTDEKQQEEYRKLVAKESKRSLYKDFILLLNIVYFVYMFYILAIQ